jgi:hypothetical protein
MRTNHVNVSHPSFFDGSNYDYWKTCMRIHLKAMGGTLENVVVEGYVVRDPTHLTQIDNDNLLSDA